MTDTQLLAVLMAILQAGDRAHPNSDIGTPDYYADRAMALLRQARETLHPQT